MNPDQALAAPARGAGHGASRPASPPRLLLAGGAAIALACAVAALAPTAAWHAHILRPEAWSVADEGDLRRVRQLCAAAGALLGLWLAWARAPRVGRVLARLGGGAAREAALGLLAVATALVVVRFFQVLSDRVRILGPAADGNPFYAVGRFLGKEWMVPVEAFLPRDYFTSVALVLAAFVAFAVKDSARSRPAALPWGFMGAGLLWAGLDEVLNFHEFIGQNAPLLRETTATLHPDDLVMLAYFAAGAAVFCRHARSFAAHPIPFAILLLGAAAQGAAAMVGGFAVSPTLVALLPEEYLEVAGALLYLLAVLLYARAEQGGRDRRAC